LRLRFAFKILFRKFSSRHRSTCGVQISLNLADGKSLKSCVIYLTGKENKISPASKTVTTARERPRPKSAGPARNNLRRVPQISSKSVHFTFDRVIAERVNTAK